MLLIILFLTTFLLYLHHLSPSVYGGDVGDLVTAAVVKGIAHPPGYPLFTMLGIILLQLPIDQTPAWKVGLISVLFSSLGVVLMYVITYELTRKRVISVITAFTLAFSYMFWLYAEVAEVFALNNFFFLLLLYLAIRYSKSKKPLFLYLLAFSTGLSFAHHQIVVLLLPTLAVFVLATNWRAFLKPNVMLPCLFLFSLGLMPYLYIAFAGTNTPPPIRWIREMTPNNFIRFVLRLDYGWIIQNLDFLSPRFLAVKIYFLHLWSTLSPLFLGLVVLGAIDVYRKKKIILLLSLLLGFILLGPFYIVYGFVVPYEDFVQGVLERFYMISTLFLFIIFPFGILFIVESVAKMLSYLRLETFKRLLYERLLLLPFLLIPLLFFLYNYPRTDLHDVWVGDNLGRDILEPLPRNSALFIQGDTILLNTVYMQYARDTRKDIQIFNIPRTHKDEFFFKTLVKVAPPDKTLSIDTMNLLVMQSLQKERPVFSIIDFQSSDLQEKNVLWVPYGLLLKLADEKDRKMTLGEFIDMQEKIWQTLHIPPKTEHLLPSERNLTIIGIPRDYAWGYIQVAAYLEGYYKEIEKAKEYYQKAIDLDPEMDFAYLGLGKYYLKKNDCQKAEELFKHALSLKPWGKYGYLLLYEAYSVCFKNQEEAKRVADEYLSIFKSPIAQEYKEKN